MFENQSGKGHKISNFITEVKQEGVPLMACIKSSKLNLKPRYKASKLACLQRWLPAKSVIGPKKVCLAY